MSSQILPFKFEESEEVRTLIEEGKPRFVAADLCTVLGLKDVTSAVRNIPERDKGPRLMPSLGGPQSVITLTEAGMWRLVMRSDKPRALQLQQWIAEEVLPSLRKTGSFLQGVSEEYMDHPSVKLAIDNVRVTAALVELQNKQRLYAQQQLEHHTILLAHDQKLKTIEENIAIVDDYTTIKGACKRLGVLMDSVLGSRMGTLAGTRTRAAGMSVLDTFDTQHGTVHTYPREIADAAIKFLIENEPQRLVEKQEKQAKKEARKLEKLKKAAAAPTSNGATQPELTLTGSPAVTPQA